MIVRSRYVGGYIGALTAPCEAKHSGEVRQRLYEEAGVACSEKPLSWLLKGLKDQKKDTEV